MIQNCEGDNKMISLHETDLHSDEISPNSG
jgi:hypothetical protein